MSYSIGNKTYSCPLILILDAISGKWKGVILWFLLENPVLRFSSLKTKINETTKISDRMLIQCLRELEADGLIERKIYLIVPPKVEYFLTDVGKNLRPIFTELVKFGLGYKKK